MSIKHEFRRLLWKLGYDISRFTPTSHPLARKKRILESFNIDTVLDIGANVGQFGYQLRRDIDYKGEILSFEPINSAFNLLEERAKDDLIWKVFNFAIGDSQEKREINIARNLYSSSILDVLPSLLDVEPQSKYINTEKIHVKTLDSIFNELCKSSENIYMKIDTQGYESKVLMGAEKSLEKIHTVQMEMSLVPLYEGEILFDEMYILMTEKNYSLISIEVAFSDPITGQVLQVDGVFHRF